MKKILIIFSIFFLFVITNISDNDESMTVMSTQNIQSNHYELIFDNELLNFRNFKLKLASLTSYEYNITKVYINYTSDIKKEYFSFDNTNLNIGINKLKEEYIKVLKDNYLYDELDKNINDVVIKKVEVYAEEKAIKNLRLKYPKVIVKKIVIKN